MEKRNFVTPLRTSDHDGLENAIFEASCQFSGKNREKSANFDEFTEKMVKKDEESDKS